MNKLKEMFRGFIPVFNFTGEQTVKNSKFKTSTIIICIIFAIIGGGISIIFSVTQDKENKEDEDYQEISIISYINETSYDDNLITGFADFGVFENTFFYNVASEDGKTTDRDIEKIITTDPSSVVMVLSEKDNMLSIKYYISDISTYDVSDVENFASYFNYYLTYAKIDDDIEIGEKEIVLYNAPAQVQVAIAGEEAKSEGVQAVQIIVPMLFSLILYTMVLLYGQNITKIVVAEKSSKLMEMLLTYVKPYGIIAGKIFSISIIAIVQMLVFFVSGIAGFIAGDMIAQEINPDYVNYVKEIIIFINDTSNGFSIVGIIIALITIAIGFLLFAVLAGLVASFVDRMEDLSTTMALFQIPVIVGFMASYFSTLSENEVLTSIFRYIPVTSPFMIPADVMIGNISIGESILSLIIMSITLLILILITGNVYKGKIFNRK